MKNVYMFWHGQADYDLWHYYFVFSMASGISHRPVTGQSAQFSGASPQNGQGGSNSRSVPLPSSPGMSLPVVDAEKLKARLYSYAPQQAPVNKTALRFNRPTNAQLRKGSIPRAPKLEPLVSISFYYYHYSPLKYRIYIWQCLATVS